MRLTDRSVWTAPPPNAVRQATAQPVNPQAGLAIYYYWIVAHYPIGKMVSEPFQAVRAPMPITSQNAIFISWEAAPTATSYDILRTTRPQLPTDGTPTGLVIGLTVTTYLDQRQTLFAYDTTELMHGSPVDGWALMNNKDFQEPVLELWPTVSISKIIFADGSQQNSAGGGVISGVVSVFGRTGVVVAQYGDYNASQIPLLPSIGPWTNVENALQAIFNGGAGAAGSNGDIQFNNNGVLGASPNLYWDNVNGRLAIGSGSLLPSAELVITSQESTVGVITAGRFTNDNLPPGVYQYKSRGTLAAPLPVQTGDFIYRLHYAGNCQGTSFTGNHGSIAAIMTSTTLADMLFYTNDGTDPSGDGLERMRITASGNIGVGVTVPGTRFDVLGHIRSIGGVDFPVSGVGVEMGFLSGRGYLSSIDRSVPGQPTNPAAYHPLQLEGSPIVIYAYNQLVGVGTVNPAYALDVVGDVNITGVYRVNGSPVALALAAPATDVLESRLADVERRLTSLDHDQDRGGRRRSSRRNRV